MEDKQRPEEGFPPAEPPSKAGLKSFIPNAIVAAIVCVVLILQPFFPLAVSRNDLDAGIKTATVAAESAKASATDALNKANTATQDIKTLKEVTLGNYATKDSVQSAVQTAIANIKMPDVSGLTVQINTANSKVDSLTKQVTEDQSTIKVLQTQITTLQAQITALNTTPAGSGTTVPTTGTVKASFSTSNWVPTSYTPTNTTPTFQLPFKLTITNGLNKQITNLQVFISMYASGNIPGATGVTLQSLSGGTWSTYTSSANTFYFTNSSSMSSWGGTSLTIPANSSTTMTLIFNYTAPVAAYGTTITFSPDIAPISSSDYTVG